MVQTKAAHPPAPISSTRATSSARSSKADPVCPYSTAAFGHDATEPRPCTKCIACLSSTICSGSPPRPLSQSLPPLDGSMDEVRTQESEWISSRPPATRCRTILMIRPPPPGPPRGYGCHQRNESSTTHTCMLRGMALCQSSLRSRFAKGAALVQ